jgi:septal ring-binding cell division protein DamX
MRAAGYRGPEIFSPAAATAIARASSGLTRRINILADKALLAAFTENTHGVTPRHVRAAVNDSEFAATARERPFALYAGGALAAGIALGAALHWGIASRGEVAPVEHAAASQMLPTGGMPQPGSGMSEEEAFDEDFEALEETTPSAARASHLSADQLRRFDAYSPRGQRLLTQRTAATRELLERSPDERYSLELFMTDNGEPARMERFLTRARDWVPLTEVYVIPLRGGPHPRLRVVLGDFASREQALAAARHLPPRYQVAFHAVPRSFGELRGQI